jgi:putative membrane protein
MTYLWIKALHVIAMVAWMAGLFYLPRLFVYHVAAPAGSPQAETFATMERRLLRAIMNPALLATWVFGVTLLVLNPALLAQPWLHAKLTLVVVLTGFHMALARWRRQLAENRPTLSEKGFRFANEVPTVLMALIVILVIVRPF